MRLGGGGWTRLVDKTAAFLASSRVASWGRGAGSKSGLGLGNTRFHGVLYLMLNFFLPLINTGRASTKGVVLLCFCIGSCRSVFLMRYVPLDSLRICLSPDVDTKNKIIATILTLTFTTPSVLKTPPKTANVNKTK